MTHLEKISNIHVLVMPQKPRQKNGSIQMQANGKVQQQKHSH